MTRFSYVLPVFCLLLSGSIACSDDEGGRKVGQGSGSNGNGNGNNGSGNNGIGGPGNGISTENGAGSGECGAVLPVIYRDFRGSGEPGGHPDFELSATLSFENDRGEVEAFEGWNDMGCEMVEVNLGPGEKPVFFSGDPVITNEGVELAPGIGRMQREVVGTGCWPQAGECHIGICKGWEFSSPRDVQTGRVFGEIQSASSFNQWYNDVPGINERIEGELQLTDVGDGVYVYDTDAFFPIDGQGFGNTPGQNHNYHFTTEIHVTFQYQERQRFTFRGDDDLWIFVNGRLALDVGGLHQALTGTIDFDAQAEELGISPGGRYEMSIFHAERQTTASNFRIETNISCFEPVVVR